MARTQTRTQETPAIPAADTQAAIALVDRAFHTSRNIFMSMRGYAELIRRNPDEPHRHPEWAGKIVGQLDRLGDMMQRVERMASVEDSPVESLPVAWLLREAEREARGRTGDRDGVRLETVLDAEAWMDGRPRELVEALSCLIQNAVEASPASGVVHIHFHQRSRGGWALEILDEGPGLPVRIASRVGEPFLSRKPGHLGLGVYLSRSILQRHGCDLHIENRPEGGAKALVAPRKSQGGIQ